MPNANVHQSNIRCSFAIFEFVFFWYNSSSSFSLSFPIKKRNPFSFFISNWLKLKEPIIEISIWKYKKSLTKWPSNLAWLISIQITTFKWIISDFAIKFIWMIRLQCSFDSVVLLIDWYLITIFKLIEFWQKIFHFFPFASIQFQFIVLFTNYRNEPAA